MSTNNGPQGPQQPPWEGKPPQLPPWMQQQPQQPYQPPQQGAWQPQPSVSQPNWQGQQGYPGQHPLPYQGYPPPQPPQAPQKKKKRTGCIIGVVALVVILGLCGIAQAASKAGSQPSGNTANTIATKAPASTPVFSGSTPMPKYSPTATPKPTQAPSWHTIQTFSGNGAKKTATVSVPDSWRISWACTPDPVIGSGLLYVGVYNSDGTVVDINAVGTDCKAGNTSGNSEEHQAGQVYLDINSGIDWTLKVETFQ